MGDSEQSSLTLALVVVVLAFQSCCHGHLQLTMDRSGDKDYCGYLHCWYQDSPDNNISTISDISLYNITDTDVRTLLASVKNDGLGLKINPMSINNVSGNGSIVGINASVSINFKSPQDCQFGSFLCELEFLNMDDQSETIGVENIAPLIDECDCGDLTYQLYTVSSEISALRQQHAQLLLQYQNLSSQVTINQINLTSVQTTPPTPTTSGITPSSPVSECRRGMSHNSTRVKFLLWGQMPALCDTETDGGGWVIIQRRTKGDVDFYKDWQSYKTGFGTPDTDFWLGNDAIHNLTSQDYVELRMDVIYRNVSYYAQYNDFHLDDEQHNYTLTVSGYRGTAGDALADHNDMMFSTSDRDNDIYPHSCAQEIHGAWWYTSCYDSNLNGIWGANSHAGILWGRLDYSIYLTFSEMKLRHGNV